MQKRKKIIIMMLLLILLISTFFVMVNKKEEKGKVSDEKETIEEIDEKVEIKEEIIEETKEEQFNGTDSVTKEDNQTSSSTSSNNNSQASTSRTDDKTVDTSHPEYYIHQGKRDCTDSSDCMDISLPIQFKYKKVIANTYYVEVIAKDGTVLGYFIEYVFKDYTYSSDEECNQVGNEIKSTLSDRVTGFSCNSGNLKIITNY